MNISKEAASILKNKIPHGGMKVVCQRLEEKGKKLSYTTCLKFDNPDVIEEAYLYLKELEEQSKQKKIAGKKFINSLRFGIY